VISAERNRPNAFVLINLERRERMKLENKVAIITGGGRGIGEIYAKRYAWEGAKVVVADVIIDNAQKVAREIQAEGGQALPLHTDVASETSTLEMAEQTVARFGAIDILVNNAAAYYELRRVPWDEWTSEEWNKQWTVNVVGTWLCIKACVPHMKKRGGGKIINVTSAVIYTGQAFVLPYNCSKGALMTMTRALARELGSHNINVNTISPGWTLTEAGIRACPADEMDKRKEMFRNMRCIKRDQFPEDMAGAAVFLASEDSDFITGTTVPVDGGMVML
jgi:NAD(P)-dependent dehydrogenase (short-subunit alcohol dehydrogenase family)